MTLRDEDVTKVLEVWKQLEPGALEGANFTLLDRSALSIAISLKRIADALSYTPGPENLFDHIKTMALNTPDRGDHG